MTRRRLAAWLVGAVVALLALAQLVGPRVAASVISSRVGRYGKVDSVSVSAWPAIELLWGHVGSVRVRTGELSLSVKQAAALLWEARHTGSVDVSAGGVRLGSLHVTDATLTKRGAQLSASATISEAAVQAALPDGIRVRLLGSEGGKVEVEATGGLFGVQASVDAVGEASEGKLVAHPLGPLISGLQLTLFSDPHVYVEGVSASVAARQPASYELAMTALLR